MFASGLPIQQASLFSTLKFKEEKVPNCFINFRIFVREQWSFIRKVTSSAKDVSFMSGLSNLNPLIVSLLLIFINEVSRHSMNMYGGRGSPFLVPRSKLKYPVVHYIAASVIKKSSYSLYVILSKPKSCKDNKDESMFQRLNGLFHISCK